MIFEDSLGRIKDTTKYGWDRPVTLRRMSELYKLHRSYRKVGEIIGLNPKRVGSLLRRYWDRLEKDHGEA